MRVSGGQVELPFDVHPYSPTAHWPRTGGNSAKRPDDLDSCDIDHDLRANLHGEGSDQEGAEDGILTANEVSEMVLDGTELVVPSACETGLGKVQEGEGVYGLRRAFQMAGARTIISALWSVLDEATADFMSQLYDRSGESIPSTMRRLQLDRIADLRSKGKPDHPFTWGAFIAMGDWR